MYCILVTGIPAAGKSTMAKTIAEKWNLPVISKDAIKELLFDQVGFHSREEKVRLGTAGMEIMCYVADQLMKTGHPLILENNFEYASAQKINLLLEKHQYPALTIALSGDYKVIYQRFLEREHSPDRHRGHIVNDHYPEKSGDRHLEQKTAPITFEDYLRRIRQKGYDDFSVNGRQIKVDTTDFSHVDLEELFSQIEKWRTYVLHPLS